MTIEITVTAEPTGGLRLLPEIGGTRPARLEGQNGIGKTATIRLLVLAAGGQPYGADEEAWRSLRSNLGPAKFELRGITGTSIVEFTFDPSAWPDTPNQGIGDALGTLVVDGVPKSASTLQSLLRVEHLTGTERLVDTLKRRVEEYGGALRAVKAPLDRLNGDLVEIATLADTLEFVSPDSAAADEVARKEHLALRDLQSKKAATLAARVNSLTRAQILQSMLSSAELETRAAELSAAEVARDEAAALLAELETKLDSAIASLDAGNKTQKGIAAEERKLNSLKRNRNVQLANLATLAAAHPIEGIDLLAQLNPDELAIVGGAVEKAELEHEELESRYRQSLMTDAQRDVHNQLRVVLEVAVRRGLGDFVVLRIGKKDVSVSELSAAISAPPDPATISNDELKKARRELEELRTILDVHTSRAAYEQQLGSITETLKKLRDAAPEQDQLQEIVSSTKEERDAAETVLLAQTQSIGRLRSQGLGTSEIEAARKDLQNLLTGESVSTDSVGEALASATDEQTQIESELNATRAAVDEIEQRSALRIVTRQTLSAEVEDGTTLDWLQGPGQTSLADSKDAEAWWSRAAVRARRLTAVAESLVSTVAGLAYASSSERGSEFANVLNSVVEAQAVEDFRDPAISEALFESGTPTAIDLRKKTITWETPDGVRREKPLSTFSSGQQALGFMRAQLRVLADDPVPDRIVFLDEFGAFISADRRHPLAELLRGDELSELAAQIIIVLPLQVDYAAQLPEVTGDLQAKYKSRADAIEARGYFVESFDE